MAPHILHAVLQSGVQRRLIGNVCIDMRIGLRQQELLQKVSCSPSWQHQQRRGFLRNGSPWWELNRKDLFLGDGLSSGCCFSSGDQVEKMEGGVVGDKICGFTLVQKTHILSRNITGVGVCLWICGVSIVSIFVVFWCELIDSKAW